MSWGKQFVCAWITYFVAFCGVSGFYFDIRTGNVTKSRFLLIYSKLCCLFTLTVFSLLFITKGYKLPLFSTQSKLMELILSSLPAVAYMTIVSCIFSTQRWQHRIYEMIRNLVAMEKLIAEYSYWPAPSEQSYLRRMFWIRLLVVVPRLTVTLIQIPSAGKRLLVSFSIVGTILLTTGLYYLIFLIIWGLCYTFTKLQSYLEQLYVDPMPVSRKEQKVLEAHRMYYKLLRMTNDICEIFKYPLAFSLLQMVFTECMSGYIFCRVLFGSPIHLFNLVNEWLIMILNLLTVFEFWVLCFVANKAAKLHDKTFQLLRTSPLDSDVLKRSVGSIPTACVISSILSVFLE